MHGIGRVCVYCGSSLGNRAAFARDAGDLGRRLGTAGVGLVYGGGTKGLMGVVASAALAAGGEVVGVLPAGLFPDGAVVPLEVGPGRLDVVEVTSMHERKATMADLADAFVALPGGLGTLEEVAEIATWAQIGLHAKPVALLDTEGYFENLVRFLDRAVADGLLAPTNRAIIKVVPDVDALVGLLEQLGRPDA